MDIISYLLGKKSGGGGSNLQVKDATVTQNGTTTINPDTSYNGMSKVNLTVDVPGPTGTINITENGITDVTNYASANVNVAGAEAPDNDVNFYDYDGTRVYSYSKNDFLALNEMPANPSHTGLVAQGWNWSLADAKEYVTDYGMLEIGQMYVTDDGKTRIYINLDNNRTKIYLGAKTNYYNVSMLIEWGDDTSETVNISSGSILNTPHEYATGGKYVISISKTDEGNGRIYIPINSSNLPMLINGGNLSYSDSTINQYYNNIVEKIEIGSNINFSAGSIASYFNLETITIPNTSTATVDYGAVNGSFSYCYKLKFAVVHSNYLLNAFRNCTNLKAVSISKGSNMDYQAAFASVRLNKLCMAGTSSSYANGNLSVNARKLILPNSITNLNRSFGTSYLEYVHLPNNFSSASNLFNNASNYLNVEIPSTFGGILGNNNFNNIYSMISIKFLGNISSIGNSCFTKIYTLKSADFSNCTAVPTLGTGCFTNIPTDCKIIVPDALYEDWIVASNWSDLASNIVKVSEA